jgi:16S rRNA (guanine(527)-N(7))-methyltransferase RsmG
MCNGLKPGEMFVVAARPSMGKTSLMMNIVEHVCLAESKPSMVFSCEMSAFQLVQRLVGLRLSTAQLNALALYESELLDWNTRFNLTAIRTPQEVRTRHFLDSLTCLLALRETPPERLVDIGTGAGFPGLPLKIIYPKMTLTLVESVGKKAEFCRHVARTLGLSGVEVVQDRAEVLGQSPAHREKYDWAVARAVAILPVLAEYLLPLVRVGTYMRFSPFGARGWRAGAGSRLFEAEATFLEAHIAVVADDHVVEHGDVEELAGVDQHFGDPHILGAGRGVAAGVVVDDDHGRAAGADGLAEDLTDAHRGGVERADVDGGDADHPVARVQQHRA